MDVVFLEIVNRGIAAGFLILAVILLRFCLGRAKTPKWISCLLWAAVAVRLLCPFSVESIFSLIPSASTFDAHNVRYETPEVQTGMESVDRTVNPVLKKHFSPKVEDSVNPFYVWVWAASVVWMIGVGAMLLYAVYTVCRVYGTVRERVPLRDNIYVCDRVRSPFILGIFAPRIFLPSGMDPAFQDPVIAHEKAHISRRDYLWKPLGILILAVYWFHPLCWIAYILLCRDIELACDEKVIRQMELSEKKAYSAALLACSEKHRLITVCPLAFGEVGVKERIKKVLNYKKPALWIILAALVVCVAVGFCFLTDPVSGEKTRELAGMVRPLEEVSANYTYEEALQDGCLIVEDGGVISGGQEAFDRFVRNARRKKYAALRVIHYYNLPDPDDNRYAPEIYEEMKATYPKLYVSDIFYENGKYKVLFYEEGKLWTREFDYLIEDHYEPYSPDALFTRGETWFLCNREDVTYNEVMRSAFSSQFGAYIPNFQIYSKLEYKGWDSRVPKKARINSTEGLETSQQADPLETSQQTDPLETAISEAILDRNKERYAKGSFACESHISYGTEERDVEGSKEITVYMSVLYQEFNRSDTGVEVVSGGCNPVALTFRQAEDGTYQLVEYWEPDPVPDNLADRFPEEMIDAVMKNKDNLRLTQAGYAQAVEHWQIDTDKVIENSAQ